jgi:hypothetical protein
MANSGWPGQYDVHLAAKRLRKHPRHHHAPARDAEDQRILPGIRPQPFGQLACRLLTITKHALIFPEAGP